MGVASVGPLYLGLEIQSAATNLAVSVTITDLNNR